MTASNTPVIKICWRTGPHAGPPLASRASSDRLQNCVADLGHSWRGFYSSYCYTILTCARPIVKSRTPWKSITWSQLDQSVQCCWFNGLNALKLAAGHCWIAVSMWAESANHKGTCDDIIKPCMVAVCESGTVRDGGDFHVYFPIVFGSYFHETAWG